MNLSKDYNQLSYSKILFHFGFEQISRNKRFNQYKLGSLDLAIYRIDEMKFSCINLTNFNNYSPYQLSILLQPATLIKEQQSLIETISNQSFKQNDLNISEITKSTQIIRLLFDLRRLKNEHIDWLNDQQRGILESETFQNKIFISKDQISLPLFVKNSILNFYHQTQHNHTYHNTSYNCNWISNNPNNAKKVIIGTDLLQVLKFLANKTPLDYQILIIPPFAGINYLQAIHKFLHHSAIQESILIAGPHASNFQLSFKFLILDIIKQRPDINININSFEHTEISIQSASKDFNINFMKLTTGLNNTVRERLKIAPSMKFEETDEFTNFYTFQTSGNSFNKNLKTICFHNHQFTNDIFINTFTEIFGISHRFSFVYI